MAYIGNIPADKYQTLQKQSFSTSATDTYTLSYAVTNPQDLALFINNVRQNPNDAYTVSGTTLTLSSSITGSDTMYAVFLGRAVETVAPALSSVTNDMLAGSINESKLAGSIPNAKLANSSVTVNGTSIALGASGTISAGITVADNWRISTDFTGNAQPISSNLVQANSSGQGTIGSAMTVSSGVFTFPSTGIYLVEFDALFHNTVTNDSRHDFEIQVSTDGGSNWNARTKGFEELATSNGNTTGQCKALIDVTDTSQVKVRFDIANNSNLVRGGSANNQTSMMFIRLGDT